MQFQAEAAADIRADNAHISFIQTQLPGVNITLNVGNLAGQVYGQVTFRRIIIGNSAARFQCDSRLPVDRKGFLDNDVGPRQRCIHLAGIDVDRPGDIGAQFGVNQWRIRFQRCLGVHHRGQFFIVHLDQFGRVLGNCPGTRHDGRDGFTLPFDCISRQRRLRRGLHLTEVGQLRGPGLAHRRQVPAGNNVTHAADLPGRRGIYTGNFCMGVRAADKTDVEHARERNIVEVTAPALDEFAGVRSGEAGVDNKGIRHRLSSLRSLQSHRRSHGNRYNGNNCLKGTPGSTPSRQFHRCSETPPR